MYPDWSTVNAEAYKFIVSSDGCDIVNANPLDSILASMNEGTISWTETYLLFSGIG